MKRYSKQQILGSVNIIDVANKFGLSVQSSCSGNFTHKTNCPSPDHKNGSERTPSLYIDSNKNNFYCFGCSASHNVIDFYILCSGKDFSETITDLSEHVDPKTVCNHVYRDTVSNFPILINISEVIRELQKNHYHDDKDWVEDLIRKTDAFLKSIDRDDVIRAKKLLKKLKKTISGRYPSI